MEQPKFEPPERFWPYAALPERPTEEELVALDPDVHDALVAGRSRPFSITLVFPALDVRDFPRALEIARASAEFRETRRDGTPRYRARFLMKDAARLMALYNIIGSSPQADVLIDDRPVPYARELWLPLVGFLLYA